MSDLISRQAAIDVCDNAIDLWHGQLGEGIVIAVKKKIEELLPAQPEIEERKEESAQNVPKEDLISRKAAIDGVKTLHEVAWKNWHEPTLSSNTVIDMIKDLPPAQPETAKRIVGKSRNGMTLWYQCDMCNEPVDAQNNFCSGCGRRLTDG